VERLIEILAGGRGADRRTHHHEHRNGDEREVVETRPEGLGDDVERVDALEDEQEDDRHRAEAEGHGNARHEHDEGGDEDERAFCCRGHGASPSAACACSRAKRSASAAGARPNGCARPVIKARNSAMYSNTRRPRPTGMDRYGIQSRARHTVLDFQPWLYASYQY